MTIPTPSGQAATHTPAAKATPGPWSIRSFDESHIVILPPLDKTAHNALICIVSTGEGRPDGEANAELIRSAPELASEVARLKAELAAIRAGQSATTGSDEQPLVEIRTGAIEAANAFASALAGETEIARLREQNAALLQALKLAMQAINDSAPVLLVSSMGGEQPWIAARSVLAAEIAAKAAIAAAGAKDL